MSFARAISVLLLCGSSAANAADETLADKVGAGQVRRDAGRASEQAAGLNRECECTEQQSGIRTNEGGVVRTQPGDGGQLPENLIHLEWDRGSLDERATGAAGPSRYWVF